MSNLFVRYLNHIRQRGRLYPDMIELNSWVRKTYRFVSRSPICMMHIYRERFMRHKVIRHNRHSCQVRSGRDLMFSGVPRKRQLCQVAFVPSEGVLYNICAQSRLCAIILCGTIGSRVWIVINRLHYHL